MTRPVIAARLKPIKGGYLVLCGQGSCGAQLGAIPQTTGGWPFGGPVMFPPDNPEISAAPGYSRRYEDGEPIYSLIRPRFDKTPDGQLIRRRKGRRDIRAKNPHGEGSVGLGTTGPRMLGHGAPLPARVDCPDCPRRNDVPVPGTS